ncbi:serine/threonine-protein kinase Nek6-like [Gigantopelta aegis]|uniref:serine/threonine-protein kinase Nek6-like n=1 Tax=Gigantopelta aegis TaxID=1735272 RepID=UPI001B88B1ED|nr:serine/threonine-protein kinase Nek6-like [Gigantopelta aegis]XP_041366555.1 serine/threonine-protein kinase Nek6-like [Gigantopelta aegis]
MSMENYQTIHRLGSGSCGSVYLVRHVHSRKLFAMKKIDLDETKKTRTKEAVLKEASILSKLKHPHIVAYHESFFEETDGTLVIIQDYCDGGTLADKIIEARNKQSHFEEKQIMQWFIQIVMAVQFIHSNKVLHRDLKTENVFLTKKNVVKIGDFGIAKTLDSTIDVAKTVVGTPTYLSPELCQDIPYNSKSDIWAVGCVLYELCALSPPFDAQNIISLFYKIIKAEFEPIPSQYSVALQELTKMILVKTPEDRPSASAILNLPLIKDHLTAFIEEKKEDLQHQKVQRDTSKLSLMKSPCRNISPNSINLSPSPRAKRKHAASLSPIVAKNQALESPTQPKLSPIVSPHQAELPPLTTDLVENGNGDESVEQIDYSDDFDESSGSEIEEDIEEPSKDLSEGEVEYDDDFEDSDSDETLEEIVHQAKEAAELEPVDDFFADSQNSATLTCATILKKQCLEALESKKYEDVQKMVIADTLKNLV